MLKILTYGMLLVAGIYGVGYYNLSESGVNRLLDKMQVLTVQGDAQALCDLMADDMKVAITDHTVEIDRRLGNGKTSGGKAELCAHLNATVKKMPGLQIQTQRNGMQVNRRWSHPWTADVSYNEKQTATVQAGGKGITIKTESDDKWRLVMTFSGVKVKRLESEAWFQ